MPDHHRSIIRLGLPLLAGNLSMYLYRLADSIMVGRLGVDALAGIAVGTLYATMHEMLVWPIALGTQAVVSRRLGRKLHRDHAAPEGDLGRDDTGIVLIQGVFAGIAAGCTAFILANAAPLVVPWLTPAATAETTLAYVRISMWGLPIMGIASGLRGFAAGVRHTKIVMQAILLSNALNVFLNWVFIFGTLGAPALGVRGAAIGTLVAHVATAVVLGLYVLKARGIQELRRTPARPLPQAAMIGRIVVIGLPSAIQNALAMLFVLLFQGMIGTLGSVYVAVTHVLFNSLRINKTLVGGFANGASILVGNFLGAGRTEDAVGVVRAAQRIAFSIGAVVFCLILAAAPVIGRIFALEGEALRLAALGLRVFAPFFLIELLGYSLEIIFSHNGWGRFVLFSELSTNVVGIIAIPALLIYGFGFGIAGAWGGFALYQVAHAGILGYGHWTRRWLSVEVERSAPH